MDSSNLPVANRDGDCPAQREHVDNEESDLKYFDPGGLEELDELETVRAHNFAVALGQSELPSEDTAGDLPAATSRIENIKVAQAFIKEIHAATLDNGNLESAIINQLRNPLKEPTDISNPDIQFSLKLYMAITNVSDETYTTCRNAILGRYPDSGVLSHHSIKKLVAEITGVVTVYDDMCINSCHAFTGPFSQLESCTVCGESRYNAAQLALTGKKVPCQQFCTILLGPQLQALRRSRMGATGMCYLDQKMKEVQEMLDGLQNNTDIVYDDILSGSEMQELANHINSDDTIISSSLDGAQLYQNKKSDTWLSIWILNNLSPSQRYKKKHILPGTIIPGPNKPKIIDSFLFRGMHHLSALQRENGGAGLPIWDALAAKTIQSCIVFALSMADAVGMAEPMDVLVTMVHMVADLIVQ
jgi:hypothetical protein